MVGLIFLILAYSGCPEEEVIKRMSCLWLLLLLHQHWGWATGKMLNSKIPKLGGLTPKTVVSLKQRTTHIKNVD